MTKSFWVALAILGSAVVIILILATGGGPGTAPEDPAGDVVVDEGEKPPSDPSLADIVHAEVRSDGPRLVFEVELGDRIPKRVRNGSFELRWDISENGDDTWIVSATVNVATTAAVTAQKTNYGSSTIDDTLPGTVETSGNTLTVTIERTKIEGFPEQFQWLLRSTLDADRTDPASAVARDTAPDSGPGRVRD